MSQQAFINKDVLRWAVERAGPNREAALGSLSSRIDAWLETDKYPTFIQAQDLAGRLAIPLGYFFLSELPRDELPIPDLRTPTDNGLLDPSLNLLEQLDIVYAKQRWYRNYRIGEGAEPLDFVGSVSLRANPSEVSGSIRVALGLGTARRPETSWSAFLTTLVRAAEGLGILVLRSGVVGMASRKALDPREFQGFAIADDFAPLVFINSADYVAARIFTIAHELAHIWLGESGISLVSEENRANEIEIERYCNTIAAELLVPSDLLDRVWQASMPLDEQTGRLAAYFRVSSIVILRRARELEKITVNQFIDQIELERGRQTPPQRGSGGSGRNNILARNGSLLTNTVIGAAMDGRIGFSDASSVLGVKVQTIKKLAPDLGIL